jgi:hypothetical protein
MHKEHDSANGEQSFKSQMMVAQLLFQSKKMHGVLQDMPELAKNQVTIIFTSMR